MTWQTRKRHADALRAESRSAERAETVLIVALMVLAFALWAAFAIEVLTH